MLEKLIGMFAGKAVRITHSNNGLGEVKGVCKTVHETPRSEGQYDIELGDGSRWGFVPEVVTETSSDGDLKALVGGRRRIEVVPAI